MGLGRAPVGPDGPRPRRAAARRVAPVVPRRCALLPRFDRSRALMKASFRWQLLSTSRSRFGFDCRSESRLAGLGARGF